MNSNLVYIFSFSLITFLIWLLVIPFYIKILHYFKIWKQIRVEATIWKATEFAKLHKKKTWTPTMWWLIILIVIFFMVILSIILQKIWVLNNSLFNQKETYLSLFTLWTVWLLWAIDDYLNVKWLWRTKWLSARFKIFWLFIFAWLWALWFYYKLWWGTVDDLWNFVRTLKNPFWNNISIWIYFIPLFIFIIIATSNSVNITDGLDWLAWGLLLFSYWVYGYITYDQGLYLLSTLCVAIVWVLLSFLWFNVKPAKFYMWDVWSLALGANLWIISMITNTVFVLIVVGSIFIFETISVIIQLTSKKFRNWKKIFKIAPFHHHLEAIWWTEENVVFRLWIVWILLSVIWVILYNLQK